MENRGGRRDNAGRPRNKTASKTISVRLPVTTIDIIRKHADFSGVSVNKLITESIVRGEYLAYNDIIKTNKKPKTKA